ncbi:MAG: CRISPR-associated endonuclease Cas3'', partial [Clostridiales bacterium]|nr:CRISPR-associated endonuclease Cas3'' [Clostridiales bacterium]
MQDYSPALQSLWSKKARDGSLSWLPLTLHALDCAQVAHRLWHHWLPRNVQMLVAQGLDLPENSSLLGTDPLEIAEQTFVFLTAVHDLGKATPAFQTKRASFHASSLLDEALLDDLSHVNLYLPRDRANPFPQAAQSPHALATEHLLRQNGCPRALAAIPGAHHGKPADGRMLTRQRIDDYPENYYVNADSKAAWQGVQNALLQDALRLAGIDQPESLPVPNMAAQILLSGLLIVADWISSNDRHYPLFEHDAPWQHLLNETELERRADTGWRSLNLPPYWQAQLPFGETEDLYAKRFALEPGKTFRPTLMQQRVADIARGMVQPGILVIEAPMGKGKTEAALAAVEILAARTGSSGLFFALPTQATSDGIFPRIKTWAEALERGGANTIRLAHSKAQFNTDYRALMEGSRNIDPD